MFPPFSSQDYCFGFAVFAGFLGLSREEYCPIAVLSILPTKVLTS
jgi:hypothetical protein